jgi:hypothetical protein
VGGKETEKEVEEMRDEEKWMDAEKEEKTYDRQRVQRDVGKVRMDGRPMMRLHRSSPHTSHLAPHVLAPPSHLTRYTSHSLAPTNSPQFPSGYLARGFGPRS